MAVFIPQKGDFISYFFSGQTGHEQHGRRPALVISNDLFNQQTGMTMVCPITNSDRGYPFHLPIPAGHKIFGTVMVDQMRTIDYQARKVRFLDNAPDSLVEEALLILDRIVN